MTAEDMELLRSRWSALYTRTLPKLARAKDPAQPKWPVTLDHCFARIILDNTIGRGELQWDLVIQKPAVRNMDAAQLKEAIALGESIQNGEADLVELDQKSLEARGKGEKKYGKNAKRERESTDDSFGTNPSEKKVKKDRKTQSLLPFAKSAGRSAASSQLTDLEGPSPALTQLSVVKEPSFANPNTAESLVKIQSHTSLTPYRKRLYSTLLSVPPGYYTTYQAMAVFLGSSARAVGSGMRNNPFAPDVPCHRVLASDGSIGGFYGDWGEEGKHAGKKRDLLKSEGVYFDSRGKVKGPVFRDFEDFSKRTIP